MIYLYSTHKIRHKRHMPWFLSQGIRIENVSYVAFLIRKKWRSVTICRKASKLYHSNNSCWCARYSDLGVTSWQALSSTPSAPKQRVSDGCNKVLSHWQASREKKQGSCPTVSYCCCGWWMCLWPRPTWTSHLFIGVTTSQTTVVSWCSCVWGKHICSEELRALSCPWLRQKGNALWAPVGGVRVAKPSQWATVFQVFSTIQGKQWPSLFCHFCPWVIAIIMLLSRPCARPAHVAESWPRARLQKLFEITLWAGGQ